MSVQNSADINIRPFVLAGNPVALRKDNAIIEQDAGRSTVLSSRTLLSKKLVDSAITPVAGTGNTGNGTCTVASVVGINTLGERVIPQSGTWKFILTAALIGKIQDPSGVDVIEGIALNDGTTTIVKYAGLIFTITDGGTAFVATDEFDIPVVANNKFLPYDPAGVLGEAMPKGIYDPEGSLGDITAAAIVAGDVVDIPVLISGARFDKNLLVLENSGALTDVVPGTSQTVEEYLRQFGLVAEETIAASSYENS